jgi:hypothetical protein
MAKPKREKHVSPRGIALHPWLNKADTKFNADGDFKVTLRVPGDQAEEFITLIDANTEAYRAEAMEKLKDPKVKASFKKAGKLDAKGNPHVHAPYSEVLNDAGEATGEIDFAFKCPAKGQDKKTGKTWINKIVMFDAGKKEVTGVAVWGGSEIKVRCTMNAYLTVLAGLGTSLRMDAVQIFKLSQGNGSSAAGFDEEEGEEIEAPGADASAGGTNAAGETDF